MERRDFLSLTGTFTGGVLLLPNFLHAAVTRDALDRSGNKLVFVQLNGGNDGLNTIVPFNDPLYYKHRRTVAIKKNDVLRMNSEIGWHPSLKGLADIQQQGQLTLLQNVGYPNPIRSHFRSQEIWQTASGSGEYLDRGWLGRYLDVQCKEEQPTAAVNIDKADNLALSGDRLNSITVPNPQLYRSNREGQADNTLSINPQLDFVRRIARSSAQGAELIQAALSRSTTTSQYPNTGIGRNLKWIARLIKGDLNSRIFYTSMTGFDTHDNQLVRHQRLMTQLSEAVTAFYSELKEDNLINDTTVVIFSEFGRRVKDNGSGTDHGAAAPMMIIGGANKGNVLGESPDLFHLDKGDLKFKIDFRDVYASLLADRMEMNPKTIGLNNKPLPGIFG
jgi:uncharacterized protein (DUF1501 family)